MQPKLDKNGLQLVAYVRGRALECMLRRSRQLTVCVSFKSDNQIRGERTNMVVVKIAMVSGYWPVRKIVTIILDSYRKNPLLLMQLLKKREK